MSESPRIHGGVSDEELSGLGLARAELLDLSVNVNPWGPHPEVLRAVQRAAIDRYPNARALRACLALAQHTGEELARIVVGHGSTELLWSAVSLLRGTGRPLVVVGPTFCEPQLAAHAWDVPCVEFRTRREEHFALDLAALSDALRAHDAAGVYLCQPNNPDGGALPAASLRELAEAHRERLFVLDQAFLALSTRHADAAQRYPDNVLVVRSLTKEHALPGLRVGYALGAPDLLARLNERRPSWMVSGLAEAAIVATCEQSQYVREVREKWLAATAQLARECMSLGLRALPSTTPFFLLQVGTGDADGLRSRLLARHRIAVRSGRSFGLPDYVRIAGCRAEERARVLEALRAELCA